MEKNFLEMLNKVTHVVIKLGTNVLTPHISTGDDESYFHKLADEVEKILKTGRHVTIVSSGAVGLGRKEAKRRSLPDSESLRAKQALASIGQSWLIDIYREAFGRINIPVAQILVARDDFRNREHYQNLRNTIATLHSWGCIPIVNENDAVAVQELRLGDNDTLSAQFAGMYPHSLLIILTSVDGFYIENQRIESVTKLEERHFTAAMGPDKGGIGGMRTKLRSARLMIASGQMMNICSGAAPGIISEILQGKHLGTWFYPAALHNPLSARKRWMLHNKFTSGTIEVDDGARRALVEKSASLLPVGIRSVQGDFRKGDLLMISSEAGKNFARGISSYDSRQLAEILLNKEHYHGKEIIHRDNLVFIDI